MRAFFVFAAAAVAAQLVAARDATDALTKVNVNMDDICAFDQDRNVSTVFPPLSDEKKKEIRDKTNLILILATDINKNSLNTSDLVYALHEAYTLYEIKSKNAKLDSVSETAEGDQKPTIKWNKIHAEAYFTMDGYYRVVSFFSGADCKASFEEKQADIALATEITTTFGFVYHFYCLNSKENSVSSAKAFRLQEEPLAVSTEAAENPLEPHIIKDDNYTIDADKDEETVYNRDNITLKELQEKINLIQLYTSNIHRNDINATGIESVIYAASLFGQKLLSIDNTTEEAQRIVEEVKRLEIPDATKLESHQQFYFTKSGYFRLINFVESNVHGCAFFKKEEVQKVYDDINGIFETVGIRQYTICIDENADAETTADSANIKTEQLFTTAATA